MGDRANIIFNTKKLANGAGLDDYLNSSIVLYTHWNGYEFGGLLAAALKAARGRWDDEAYAIRIIVSRVVDDHMSETGHGLCVGEFCDNDNPYLVVDFANKVALAINHRNHSDQRSMPFAEFAELDESSARKFHLGKDA